MTLSYWLDTSYVPSPPLQEDATAEAAVIGAGMTGIGIACFLRDRGVKTIVLERGTVAGGATGRNTGFLVSGLGEHYARSVELWGRESAAAISRFHLQNHALLAEFVARFDLDCDYARDGSFVIALDSEEEELLRLSHTLMQEDGLGCEFVEPSGIRKSTGVCGLGGGLFNPTDGHVDPVRLTRGMAAAARSAGTSIFEQTRVGSIRRSGRSWVVETERAQVAAPLVFLALNAWTPALLPEVALEPVRGQCVAFGPLEHAPVTVSCYTNYGSEYWRGAGNYVLAGGMRTEGGKEESGDKDGITPPVQLAIERFYAAHLPFLQGVPAAYRWSGVMSYSGDGLPLIGGIPGREGVYVAAGYTGHGFGWAFLAAKWLVRLALDGVDEIPELCRISRRVRPSPSLKYI